MIRRRRLTALLVLAVAGFAFLEVVVGPASERARHGAEHREVAIDSKDVGQKLTTEVIVPSGGGEGRPILVFLHGRGNGPSSNVNEEMYDAIAAQGKRAPVVAFPDGGDHSYWHDRADGKWSSYVADEVIPRVAKETGADPRRVAIGGISMGGYGSFEVARSHPGRFCAIGGHSPAIFPEASASAPGAFDDAEDFAGHDVFAAGQSAPAPFLGVPIWLDAGTEDSLHTITQRFATELEANGADVSLHDTWPGGHDGDYWHSHLGAYLRFYATALAACGR